ncbi:hypothetical protein E2C01_099405 [Portunus trituberculatus]|uniref:Uncharacterized protein n=1 Tax=Portunus trituberculatus TaxID=210409 RepID=A0A5B7KAQ1_PORTR|nr:hypothetical protein [Portunus trituberculatus]
MKQAREQATNWSLRRWNERFSCFVFLVAWLCRISRLATWRSRRRKKDKEEEEKEKEEEEKEEQGKRNLSL